MNQTDTNGEIPFPPGAWVIDRKNPAQPGQYTGSWYKAGPHIMVQMSYPIYSMEAAQIDFYPYQFKPVLKFIDLELDFTQRHWMSRLGVAYGLSFHQMDLAGFTYPGDVERPEPDSF